MTSGSKFAAKKELPPKLPADHVAELIQRLTEVGEGDMEAVISACLDASWRVVENTDLIQEAVLAWFKQQSEEIPLSEVSARFSDGIANAQGLETPEKVTTLRFYDKHYEPDSAVEEIYADLAGWRLPTGAVLWCETAVADLEGSGKVVTQHHANGTTPSVVIPLYIYSASQLGYRVVWCANIQGEVGYTLLKDPAWEAAYQAAAGATFHVERAWAVPLGGLGRAEVALESAESWESDSVKTFNTVNAKGEQVQLVRFECHARGDATYSPYHDTVCWLPAPDWNGEQHFKASLQTLPPAGMLEYLYARGAEDGISWHGTWSSKFALGSAASHLIAALFSMPDQQTYDAGMYEKYCTLVECLLGTEESRIENEKKITTLLASLVPAGDSDDPMAQSFEAVKMYIESGKFVSNLHFAPSVVRRLIDAKLGSNAEPSPAALAHSLEIQELLWQGKRYLLSLSGDRRFVVASDLTTVVEVFRMNHQHDDQVFWQLNAAMRHFQFETPTQLEVYKAPHAGRYVMTTTDGVAPPTFVLRSEDGETKTASYSEGAGWSVAGDALQTGSECWLQLGSFLLSQARPLMYWIDTALKTVDAGDTRPRTYRGLKNVALPVSVYGDGKVVLWAAYSSSTTDRGVASSFAKDEGKAAIFSLQGSTCVCISPWSRFSRERELLFPPNCTFVVTSALSSEQQEILGVSNLQLFSMDEVDAAGTVVVYLRKVVNQVISSVDPADVPKHVRQLFNIMRCFEEHDLDGALEHACNPNEPVLNTMEGVLISNMLLELGASPAVRSRVALSCAHPEAAILAQLVKVAGTWDEAFGWMATFEARSRRHLQALFACELDAVRGVADTCLAGFAGHENLRMQLLDRVSTSEYTEAVEMTGITGPMRYLNGLYRRMPTEQAGRLGFDPHRSFVRENARVGAHCTLSYRKKTDQWVLTDMYSNAARQESLQYADQVVSGTHWDGRWEGMGADWAVLTNSGALGRWEGLGGFARKATPPTESVPAALDLTDADRRDLVAEVAAGGPGKEVAVRMQTAAPRSTAECAVVQCESSDARWKTPANFVKRATKIPNHLDACPIHEIKMLRRHNNRRFGASMLAGVTEHTNVFRYSHGDTAPVEGGESEEARLERGLRIAEKRNTGRFAQDMHRGYLALQALDTAAANDKIRATGTARRALLDKRVLPNDCSSTDTTSLCVPDPSYRRRRAVLHEVIPVSQVRVRPRLGAVGCAFGGVYTAAEDGAYTDGTGCFRLQRGDDGVWALRVSEAVARANAEAAAARVREAEVKGGGGAQGSAKSVLEGADAELQRLKAFFAEVNLDEAVATASRRGWSVPTGPSIHAGAYALLELFAVTKPNVYCKGAGAALAIDEQKMMLSYARHAPRTLADVVGEFATNFEAKCKAMVPWSHVLEAKFMWVNLLTIHKDHYTEVTDEADEDEEPDTHPLLDVFLHTRALEVAENIIQAVRLFRKAMLADDAAVTLHPPMSRDNIPDDGVLMRAKKVSEHPLLAQYTQLSMNGHWTDVSPPTPLVTWLRVCIEGGDAVNGLYTRNLDVDFEYAGPAGVTLVVEDNHFVMRSSAGPLARSESKVFRRPVTVVDAWEVCDGGGAWKMQLGHVTTVTIGEGAAKQAELAAAPSVLAPQTSQVAMVCAGQAGVQIGHLLLRMYEQEDPENNCVFGTDGSAHAVFLDTDPNTLNTLRRGRHGFLPDKHVHSIERASDTCTWGAGLALHSEATLDTVHRMLEGCDTLASIQFLHAAAGGTGGPLTAALLDVFDAKGVELDAFPIMPSMMRNQSGVASSFGLESALAPYHTPLYYNSLYDKFDLITPFDNNSVTRAILHRQRQARIYTCDLNEVIANCIAATTEPLRHPQSLIVGTNPAGITTSLRPYRDLRMAWAGIGPLSDTTLNPKSLTQLVANSCTAPMLRVAEMYDSELFSSVVFARGRDLEISDLHDALGNMSMMKGNKRYVGMELPCVARGSLLRKDVMTSLHGIMPPCPAQVVTLATGRHLAHHFEMVEKQYALQAKHGAFMHWMKRDGVEKDTLGEAVETVKQIRKNYNELGTVSDDPYDPDEY